MRQTAVFLFKRCRLLMAFWPLFCVAAGFALAYDRSRCQILAKRQSSSLWGGHLSGGRCLGDRLRSGNKEVIQHYWRKHMSACSIQLIFFNNDPVLLRPQYTCISLDEEFRYTQQTQRKRNLYNKCASRGRRKTVKKTRCFRKAERPRSKQCDSSVYRG